ncbi:hypothetical protein PsYK624_098690 [Phanerochaete sordida]|uniref:Heterokaryon incompatibility domain-containing protein n=1 Tax=Phanerochaete sordida TaxID=48140 RepID=A0A9P3GCR2_9APHY|nr:hypothetical protein PsYK624_098690 [Phanerochaete sordida]
MFFVVPETSICFSSDYVPWASASSVITIHGHIEKRSPTVLDDFWGSASDHFIAADCNRAMIWGVVHMVSLGLVSPQDIFQTSVSGGECYTLTPPVRSALPLQWIHIGPKAIPNVLADVSCQVMDAEDLLAKLNSVLGTSHSLDTPDLHELLVYALNTSRDFGEVYGMLRGSWPADGDFFLALDRITDRQAQVQRRRDNAQRGTAIEDSEIHPRRIWDLYSNRVLPFHAMLRELYNGNKKMPAVLWTISHSWVEEARRANVNTTINGMQWLVPVPVDTSLENVRIELLNMGAEYVWLDVLCLRQVDDEIRLKEWGLDIPTIGHIFQASPKDRPCVTYFNGLGLPLDMSKATCESNRHWFQRVWTLQESLVNWLPGGLVLCKEADDEDKIFARLDRLLSSVAGWDGLPAVIRTIGERSCTTELDRVAGLARYLRCATLPIYDRAASVEKAWTALLKHMHELPRTALFVQYAADTPFAPWPSWAALLAERPVLPYSAFEMPMSEMFRLDCKLYLVDQVLLYTSRPGRYWHEGHAVGPFHATLDAPAANGEHLLHMHFSPGTTKTGVETFSVPVIAQHGIILPNVPYTLVGMGPPGAATYWVVTEVVGEQRLRNDTALTVVKWGVLYIDKKDGGLLGKLQPDRITKQVVYLSGEEALTKSAYVEEYLQAFSRERSGGTE